MWDIIFWIIVVVVVIGLVWYFLKQKKAPTPAVKPEEEFKIPTPEEPPEAPPETPPSETPPGGTPTI